MVCDVIFLDGLTVWDVWFPHEQQPLSSVSRLSSPLLGHCQPTAVSGEWNVWPVVSLLAPRDCPALASKHCGSCSVLC
eukprot:11296674-Prorocentrum_lima.AAC.1